MIATVAIIPIIPGSGAIDPATGGGACARPEIRRDHVEIQRIDGAVIIKIALRPDRAAGRAEVRCKRCEVGGGDLAIDVGIAEVGVRDDQPLVGSVVVPSDGVLSIRDGGRANLAGGKVRIESGLRQDGLDRADRIGQASAE